MSTLDRPLVKLHDALAKSGAKAHLRANAARNYGMDAGDPGGWRRSAALLIESHVEVPKKAGELLWDVLDDMTREFVQIEQSKPQALPPPQLNA